MSVGADSVSIYAHNGIMREWLLALIDHEPIEGLKTKPNDTFTLFGNWCRVGNVKKGII